PAILHQLRLHTQFGGERSGQFVFEASHSAWVLRIGEHVRRSAFRIRSPGEHAPLTNRLQRVSGVSRQGDQRCKKQAYQPPAHSFSLRPRNSCGPKFALNRLLFLTGVFYADSPGLSRFLGAEGRSAAFTPLPCATFRNTPAPEAQSGVRTLKR